MDFMGSGWVWILVGPILLVAVVGKAKQGKMHTGPWPFYSKKLMTSPEQVLYWRLVKALPNDSVFAQVQLSRIQV